MGDLLPASTFRTITMSSELRRSPTQEHDPATTSASGCLPSELVERIIEIYMEERDEELEGLGQQALREFKILSKFKEEDRNQEMLWRCRRSTHPVFGLLLASKLISDLTIPFLYRHIQLLELRQAGPFIRNPLPSSFRHVRTVRSFYPKLQVSYQERRMDEIDFMEQAIRLRSHLVDTVDQKDYAAWNPMKGTLFVDEFSSVLGCLVIVLHFRALHMTMDSLLLAQYDERQAVLEKGRALYAQRANLDVPHTDIVVTVKGTECHSLPFYEDYMLDGPWGVLMDIELGQTEEDWRLCVEAGDDSDRVMATFEDLSWCDLGDGKTGIDAVWVHLRRNPMCRVRIEHLIRPHMFCGLDMTDVHPRLELVKACEGECHAEKDASDVALAACLMITNDTTRDELKDLVWENRMKLGMTSWDRGDFFDDSDSGSETETEKDPRPDPEECGKLHLEELGIVLTQEV